MLDFKEVDGLSFKAFQGLRGLDELADEWTALVRSLPNPRFVQFPEWYRAYLSSLEFDPSRNWFVAGYRNKKLAAIFPLQFQSYRMRGIRPHVLGTIDDDEMQASDFIYARTSDNEGLMAALTHWLRKQRDLRWDELRLRKVSEDSAIAHSIRAHMPKGTLALQHDGSGYFRTCGSYDLATQAMSGTFKRNLRRLAKRAETSAPLRVQSYSSPEEIQQAFESFIAIEASGWKGDCGQASAIRCQPRMLAFYQALVKEFGVSRSCVINILYHGHEPVAGQFCIQIGTTLNILKIGFSDAHSSFAPGNLLLERMIRFACEDSSIEIVSLVNDPPWARNFKPLTMGVWSYCAPNWNARGMLVHLGLMAKRRLAGRALRKAAEAHKPTPEVEATV